MRDSRLANHPFSARMKNMKQHLIIGTRGSELALAQARLAIDAMQAHAPDLQHELRIIHTAGDQRTDLPLHQVNAATQTGDKGVFIAAIEEALAAGEIDCAVHSLKDMPGQLDSRFEIAAILPREAIADTLVVKKGADPHHLVIGTGSVRRAHFVRAYWGDLARCLPIRGNVSTRLRKLAETPEMTATLLARAGLNRLGYTGDTVQAGGESFCLVDLSPDAFMPALGQGAIAIEIRKGDEETRRLTAPANDEPTARCIAAERAFLDALQADCSVPVGGYASEEVRGTLLLRALYFTAAGQPIRITQRGPASDPAAVGRAAHKQLMHKLEI